MEKQLKCVLELSLKEMALRRVAVLLWSGSDISASISEFPLHGYYKKSDWIETIEGKVKENTCKLGLPESLTKEIIDIVRPIGFQIFRWREGQEYHLSDKYEKIGLPSLAKLCWTAAGSIDNRKTAEELVRCDSLDVVRRYRLACTNCVEDYIPLLWEELPEEKKDYFYYTVLRIKSASPWMHFCWPHILKGELSNLDYLWRTEDRNLTTFNQWAFERSAGWGNKTAAEYFFQKLTREEREASLMRTVEAVLNNRLSMHASRHELSDVFFYLLSVMTPERRTEIFMVRPIDVLWRFLDWPRQELFLENASLIWTFLSPSSYGDLLRKMADRVRYSDHYFKRWFPEFFMQSPLDFRKCFVDEDSETGETPACRFLSAFHEYEDSEYIEVIFRNVDAADRVKLVFHRRVFVLFLKCLWEDRWHMVEVYLREATLSKEDRERLKETFTGFLESGGYRLEINGKFKRFFEFLDETDASADERKKGQKRKFPEAAVQNSILCLVLGDGEEPEYGFLELRWSQILKL